MGAKKTTTRDVALALGISQSTVSRALTDSPRVALNTRRAVQSTAKRLGYSPNAIARGLSTRQTGLVGVVLSESSSIFFQELLESLALELARYKRRMLLLYAGTSQQAEDMVASLVEYQVEGAIFASVSRRSALGRKCIAAGIPHVMVNRCTDARDSCVVEGDNYAGGRLVADLFSSGGHRRVALMVGRLDTSTSAERERGFVEGMLLHGVSEVPRYSAYYSYDEAYRVSMQLFFRQELPTAIFCANDAMAMGVLDAARAIGIEVPGQLSVVGYDDVPTSSWFPYRLTTIRQSRRDLACAAVSMLMARTADPDLPIEHRKLIPELVHRESFRSLVLANAG